MNEQKMKAFVDSLKVRIFDLSENVVELTTIRKNYEETLQALVDTLDIVPGESGGIELADIIEAVKALVEPSDKTEEGDE